MSLPTVLGVDGCRAGWVGALLAHSAYDVVVAADFATLVALALRRRPDLAVVGVDMPIGLAGSRPRLADAAARRLLPRSRKSSVFPVPTRAAAEATTQQEASALNRAATGGTGLSHQAFNLLPKILDVDAFVRSDPGVRVVEVHPEVSFATIDPDCVLLSKKTAAGSAARVDALVAAGLTPPAYAPGKGYGRDDLLDACAAAWSARRYAVGEAEPLPDPPEDLDGLQVAIWR